MVWNWDLSISESDSSYLVSVGAVGVEVDTARPIFWTLAPLISTLLPRAVAHGISTCGLVLSSTPFTPTTIHPRQDHHGHPTWLPSSSSVTFILCCWSRTTCREIHGEQLFFEEWRKQPKQFFFFLWKKSPFENTETQKNKNHPFSQHDFTVSCSEKNSSKQQPDPVPGCSRLFGIFS